MNEAIGPIQPLGTLGHGAHSTILHVRRRKDGRQYALKVVPIAGREERKFLDQAKFEFRVASLLQHPNLLRIHRLECERDWLFRVRKVQLLLDYVNGKTLDQVPGLTMPKKVQIFEKIADALAHMHRRGVCHADIKPNNVMLSRTGEVKVIDFGLAWIKGEPKGRVQGTPEYMAPEQGKETTVTEQSDVYNLGATMYRILSGHLPPSAIQSGMNRHMFAQLYLPVSAHVATVPKPLCDLVNRCMAYKAAQRPQRMADVRTELQGLVEKLVKRDEDRLEGFEW